ncbi:Pectinesterase inhibitor domain [Dillenia turbinata]|uniref:Pectinesterase inhibitor domain n=1 Tax=Dillenia turbinata TaxID=194707 RepID=A0AAN8VEG1_9MAGN
MAEGTKKISVIGISSLLLVALVVGTIVMLKDPSKESVSDGQFSATNKAVAAICQPTEFKERCANTVSMAVGDTTDLKEIIMAAFQVTIDEIKQAMGNSSTLKELANEPSCAEALKVCQKVLQFSIDDLKRTSEKFGGFEIEMAEPFLNDLKIWLSGSITFQENCLDAFENAEGTAGEEMKKLLEASRQLTTNGLDIITSLSSAISSVKLPNRRLLSGKASVKNKITPEEVSEFSVVNFLEGKGSDPWIKASGVPVDM